MKSIYPLAISYFVLYGTMTSLSQDLPKQDPINLSGYYQCDGVDAEGKVYNGLTVIVKKGDVYLVSWLMEDGNALKGIGIQNGNNLSIGWGLKKEEHFIRGVTSFTIEAKDEKGIILRGGWSTFPGNGKISKEVLTLFKRIPTIVEVTEK